MRRLGNKTDFKNTHTHEKRSGDVAGGEGLQGDLTSGWPCRKREQCVAVLGTPGYGQTVRGAYPGQDKVSPAEPHRASAMTHLHCQRDGT